MRDKENIDDAKERLHRHLKHHGNGPKHDRAIDGNGCEVLFGAEDGFFDQREPAGGPGRRSGTVELKKISNGTAR